MVLLIDSWLAGCGAAAPDPPLTFGILATLLAWLASGSKLASPATHLQHVQVARSGQGKMEKSFLSFAAAYPQWEPQGGAARQFLGVVAAQGITWVTVTVTGASCTALLHTGDPGWGDCIPHIYLGVPSPCSLSMVLFMGVRLLAAGSAVGSAVPMYGSGGLCLLAVSGTLLGEILCVEHLLSEIEALRKLPGSHLSPTIRPWLTPCPPWGDILTGT